MAGRTFSWSGHTRRLAGAVSVGALTLAVVAVPGVDAAESDDSGAEFRKTRPVAPGVKHRQFEMVDDAGDRVEGDVLTVDLSHPTVSLDLLYPGVVAAREPVSTLADEQGAVAGVNGDFFDIGGTPEIDGTNAPVGPAVATGVDLTAAVPMGQRWGPPLAPETTTLETVFGAGDDGAQIGELSLEGTITTPSGTTEVDALNQYAIEEGGVGAFTSDWGTADRRRATCGSDTRRNDPCVDETIEVVVTGGVVTEVHDEPRSGAIADDTIVLVGREGGVQDLDGLEPGDAVEVTYQMVADDGAAFDFAIGGTPILRDGEPLAGLQEGVRAPRTSAGASADGSTVYLVTVDGRQEDSAGISIQDMAELMVDFGADAGVNLDGGGSTTMVARERHADSVSVVNSPSGGQERPVPNGVGVFSEVAD
ncbi:phosphodiester glycosidase family protein [Actinobacteria bacterium YIM 96077]|uniref:Phosphodiester glycosidase family protein n=1 Tax=Phytoactinopolyspora halophila TaxID=1981511 RepID=A0A329QKV5_9ACTN|nr:phosphodiester glycosidase family protein [Phytoactinopolyspora halophila]AYY12380.1 phosphodiester glycosidase family protein [Actinobacteria bacterium YIM 96077]RAW12042.1 phosphodiester glycosidase family protein [Phytoactinopolyspora halophila]